MNSRPGSRTSRPGRSSHGDELLQCLDGMIFGGRSAVYEGDVFSVLSHSPYIVRSSEFALGDGVIDCTRSYPHNMSFADRFWDLDQRQVVEEMASELLLFDIKSSIGDAAGAQSYMANTNQQQETAFFLGICAADTSYVELIPNFAQDKGLACGNAFADVERKPSRHYRTHIARESRLPSEAYGALDQCSSPYRMPIGMLTQAIDIVRRCIVSGGHYTNPWTLVEFPQWRPRTTRSVALLKPIETSDNFSAYEATMEIYRCVSIASRSSSMTMDFIVLQPRLADFKLLLPGRQVYVQHKLDNRVRKLDRPLDKILVARGMGDEREYYFRAEERFDFFFYQLTFSRLPDPRPLVEFLFIPERELPDVFYSSLEKDMSFEGIHKRYRVHMDEEGRWVFRVKQIIETCPHPRKPGDRPARAPYKTADATSAVTRLGAPTVKKAHGYRDFAQLMTTGQRQFFSQAMEYFAARMSGLLVVLARDHPLGDFGLCRYRWMESERTTFLATGRPPATAHELPADTPICPIYYFTRDGESSFRGSGIRSTHFRRLNSCQEKRLIVWDLAGQDGKVRPLVPIVMPSEDVRPVEAQRAVFSAWLDPVKRRKGFEVTPSISAVLDRPFFASEYGVGGGGPMVYDGTDWSGLWRLLMGFTLPQTLSHPPGVVRDPAEYRYALSRLHQRLFEEQFQNYFQAGDRPEDDDDDGDDDNDDDDYDDGDDDDDDDDVGG
ncbi:hypothetical protein MBLNU459_g6719t1 [Dothideomycetes sp. NU459]